MKSFAAFALVAVASALDTDTFEFMQYVSKHGKNYSTLAEFTERMELFMVTHKIITEWNADPTQTSTMGHNFLSDMTLDEKKNLRGLDMSTNVEQDRPIHTANGDATSDTLDWCSTTNPKSKNKCTPIKNQGQCGGCWAFSATETVESIIAINNDATPVEYSPQQLISCSSSYGNGGCNGGNYKYAWNYMMTNAQETEKDYPYSHSTSQYGNTGTCTAKASLGVVNTADPTDYSNVGTSVDDIKSALNSWPVSIGVDANSNIFQHYTAGVISSSSNCGTQLDHAIVAVGYGYDSTTKMDYFMVRNSWGTSWGDKGFAKLEQAANPGTCGMNKYVKYPYPINAT